MLLAQAMLRHPARKLCRVEHLRSGGDHGKRVVVIASWIALASMPGLPPWAQGVEAVRLSRCGSGLGLCPIAAIHISQTAG